MAKVVHDAYDDYLGALVTQNCVLTPLLAKSTSGSSFALDGVMKGRLRVIQPPHHRFDTNKRNPQFTLSQITAPATSEAESRSTGYIRCAVNEVTPTSSLVLRTHLVPGYAGRLLEFIVEALLAVNANDFDDHTTTAKYLSEYICGR